MLLFTTPDIILLSCGKLCGGNNLTWLFQLVTTEVLKIVDLFLDLVLAFRSDLSNKLAKTNKI